MTQFLCILIFSYRTLSSLVFTFRALLLLEVWYGMVGFNVPLDTFSVISETVYRKYTPDS